MENEAVVASAAFLTVIAYAIIIFRVLLRRLKHENLEYDDYVMLVSLIFYTVHTVCYPNIFYNGTNVGIKDPKKLSSEAVQQVILGSQWALVERLLYMTYIWTIKTCILIYFTRLQLERIALSILKFTAGFLVLTWVVCVLGFLEECIPVNKTWQVLPDVPTCARAINAIGVMTMTHILGSVLVMAIPIPKIIRARLSTKRRLQIGALYVIGIFVAVVPVIRMILVLDNSSEQAQLIWVELDVFFITVVANAPVIHSSYRHGFKHICHIRYRSDSCPPNKENDTNKAEASGGEKREGRARKTWRRISGRGNTAPDSDTIKCTVELVQHRKTGVMDEDGPVARPPAIAGKEFDIFVGDTTGQLPLARIQSHASSIHAPEKVKKSRLFAEGPPKPRKSAIPEAV